MNATIKTVHYNDELTARDFGIEIKVADGFLESSFVISEPYIITHTKWSKFIQSANGRLGFYSGSGGCVSGVAKELNNGDVEYVFTTESSGCGGDTTHVTKIPAKYLDEGLAKLIDELHARGLLED